MHIPIPYPHIANLSDKQLVPKIKALVALETSEFFYGKAAPIFIKLYKNYETDCTEVIEFINDFYADLMGVRPQSNDRKIDGFAYECQFKNWIGKLALVYCYAKYELKEKERLYFENMQNSEDVEPSIQANIAQLNRDDVNALLNNMPNEHYRDLIRLVYIDGVTLHEAAAILNVKMDNFFNMHRRAKLQYVQVYNREMKQ